MDRFHNTLDRLLKQYVNEEEFAIIKSGDQEKINTLSELAQAKAKAYQSLKESIELCENEEFNALVEQKAADYREKTLTELYQRKAQDLQIND